MAWFTCDSYYHFLYVVIYAPHLKDFVLSLGGFVVVLFCFYFFEKKKITLRKLFTLRLMGVKLPEN